MHGNVARPLYLEDQINENEPMEANIGVIENEVSHLRSDVNELKEGMKSANNTLGELKGGQAQIKGGINALGPEMETLREQINARIAGLEPKIIKWVLATGISCAGVTFAFVRVFKP